MEFSFLKGVDDLRRLGLRQQAEDAAKKAEEDAAKQLKHQEIVKEKAERSKAAKKAKKRYEKMQSELQISKESKELEKKQKERRKNVRVEMMLKLVQR